ncbi:hypothetical protein ISF_02555 [Cordyceps fumosorosea ARSEF 2679]|uniref:Uncharacterized protein n=1 Tax=Cordyceps fumosorosea (strain ARSEF 2679) TaxID=1081104 RepID=A0A168BUY3_CORFA|nr:hypothetical protein ISF_02555 [Cordyceps fumosorosea ARSEF 2679]OAA70581.1 hypothetical protein ISF_02555 [Cordyceps fumosorosea ARSEF 2679]
MFKHFRRGGRRVSLPVDEPALAPPSRKNKKRFRNVKRLSVLVVAVTIMATGFMATKSSSFSLRSSSSSWDGTVTLAQLQNLSYPRPHPSSSSSAHDAAGSTTRRLRIFMPADGPHLNLCKSVMSSVALGYPLPILLNWKGEFNRPEWHLAGSHIAKLESLHAAIDALLSDPRGTAHEDDLAVLVDAHDVWFQLPPSVLIRRYHQINKEADKRVRDQWEKEFQRSGGEDFPIPPPRQRIVVTSAKDCHPGPQSGSDPHYDHWPQSPMPAFMYGPGTDRVSGPLFDSARRFRRVRPRCVNSGMIMGTMGALRDALARSREKVAAAERAGRQLWSDQALLGEVVGEQELWREWARHLGATWDSEAGESKSVGVHRDARPVARAALEEGGNFEFGIGLDYGFATIPPTCSAEEDGYFVRLDDREQVEAESERAGVVDGVRVKGVPPELLPAAAGSNDARDAGKYRDPLRDVTWGEVPLYTDFYFGTTPVGIHHNAYVDNLKAWRIENWWERMWFYPQLRRLVSAHLITPQTGSGVRPILRLPAERTGDGEGEVVYMPPASEGREKAVTVFEPATDGGKAVFSPISWDGICQKGKKPWFEELFGDNIGPLAL